MTISLVIDNHDSFTFNLVHLLEIVNGAPPIVVRNDECSWEQLQRLSFDNIVLSPGPGHPDVPADFGVCRDVLRHSQVPVLGVCLGHQGAGSQAGGRVTRAPEPVHGKTARLRHSGQGLFEGLPQQLEVARYHSLILERPLPPDLVETAWTEDGLLMAFEHRHKPQWGVQFHPESIISEGGRELLENFRRLTLAHQAQRAAPAAPDEGRRRAFWCEGPAGLDAEAAFRLLYADAPTAFWLDGGLVGPGPSRWSYLGDARGPNAALLSYRCAGQVLEIDSPDGRQRLDQDIFAHLDARLRVPVDTPPPCPFQGGHVGWFGYELRPGGLPPSPQRAATPDALFVQVDRYLAIDHLNRRSYLVAIDTPGQAARANAWLAQTSALLDGLAGQPPASMQAPTPRGAMPEFVLDRDEATYLADVTRCLDWIGQGETYQVCLTNEIRCRSDLDPWQLYTTLRRVNPAPFAAFVRWPGGAVLSASPERFLSVDAQGLVQTKPIKGTIRRAPDAEADARLAETLRTSIKDRAENVMIVDLLRNDLSRVCQPGSVVVPKLFGIESFKTVHQLVSTVQGQLRDGLSVIDAVRATFPGGSMTGAPKERTLQLIDELEQRPRGVYSGALGWLGHDGAADLSIVIRTIVSAGGELSFGVGGGVVANSTPEGEFAEMLLKAQATMAAIHAATPVRQALAEAAPAALAAEPA
ncbi:aminodeoxychorismate synthase component I [Ideonella sp. 4Y11]|uniref:aminodeoxychorismate synthase n=1 Tax=Ideonella aquatica TaxID=2824119 RepID=A0A941BEQ4_9BURK|nr:aminodeoxychorismate synthase component I [Ideonella aquatica]MBQ0957971.1 aminodeoxychorismate synthase component I [Ideonella aquatica]